MAFDLKKLKSLFVEEAAPDPKAGATKAGTAPMPPSLDPTVAMVHESAAGGPGQVTGKFTEILFAAIEKANLPGVDYLEYRQSLKSLEKMPMEEQVRYQSAFAMAQAMGATPQKLIESAGHYTGVLRGEEAKFEQAMANQTATQIAGRKEQIQSLNTAIQQKAEQMKKLSEEMEQHRVEMEKLNREINEASAKVEATKNDFIASYQAVAGQILVDVEKMKKYLK